MTLKDFMLHESIEDKGILKAVFLSGSPGAGKTTVLKKVRSGQIESKITNTDNFFKLFSNEVWNEQWRSISSNVKTLQKNQLANYINSMLPLIVDGTSSNKNNFIRRVGLLESLGYDTALVLINASLETSLRRVKERAKQTGREVDEKFIVDAWKEVEMDLKPFYKSKYRILANIDNNDGDLTDDIINKAFKKSLNFFNSPVINPIGKEIIEDMRMNGWKYLTPHVYTMAHIKNILSVWYNQ